MRNFRVSDEKPLMYMRRSNAIWLCAVCLLLSAPCLVFSQTDIAVNSFFPISELQSSNPIFKQYCLAVEQSYKDLARGTQTPAVSFFSYTATAADDLLKVAARCSLPYETIASLNRIPSSDTVLDGMRLILPSCPGLFIPDSPETPVEYLLKKKCFSADIAIWYTVAGDRFCFLPDARMNATERAFFLDSQMRSPLPPGILTSGYGMRISPISGMEKFHKGIDLAAAAGTAVNACKSGIVEKTGFDNIYGNYVMIRHDSIVSFYAHLSEILVTQGAFVGGGTRIGSVGTTGASTGPHLHFEIVSGSTAVDPEKLLGKDKIRRNGNN